MEKDEISRKELLELARQADFCVSEDGSEVSTNNSYGIIQYELEAFAKLVALHYEKKIADLENIICQRHWDVLQEREACAKLIEVSDDVADWEIICGSDGRVLLNAMAEAIRARGEPTSRGNHNELKSSK